MDVMNSMKNRCSISTLDFCDGKAIRQEFNSFYTPGIGAIFYTPVTSDPEVLRRHLMQAEVNDW